MPPFAVRSLLSAFLLLAFSLEPVPATAQSFSVLHTFTDGADGALPVAGMIMDQAGNLYGTAMSGGTGGCSDNGPPGCGTIFELKQHNNSYIFNPLYSFVGRTDGAAPQARLTIGPNATYYGTTYGGCVGFGVVFNAGPLPTPLRTPLLQFHESVLDCFAGFGGGDGGNPRGPVIFDQAGNIFGTTSTGGINAEGTVFELSPAGGGTYTEKLLYSFCPPALPPCPDGQTPLDGVVFDSAGNIYGTTLGGGSNNSGVVFELSPSGAGWTERVIYSFQGPNDGENPQSGVAIDNAGNLYGNTAEGGSDGGGTIYELSPNGSNWNFNVLYNSPFGSYPVDRVTFDSSGNLYETTVNGGYGYGEVLELARSGNNWTYVDLYDFTNGIDGSYPYGSVVLDSSGNVYGTAENGGNNTCYNGHGCGVVWKITR